MKSFCPLFVLMISIIMLIACTPVKNLATNNYTLSAFSAKKYDFKPKSMTLLVTAPDCVSGYQTEQMRYIRKPYQMESFVKNEWVSPPADMLYPLLVQSLQRTGYFHAVASNLHNVDAEYRLDTQLLNLEQNFLQKPSVLDVTVNVELIRTADNKVLATRIIRQHTVCPMDTPYGGVIAANKAMKRLTALVSDFVIKTLGSCDQ